MLRRVILATAALAVGANAQSQYVTSSPDSGVTYAVNVPTDTASSGQGSIFFQMSAPSGTQWLGLGQGGSMSGANIFMLYSDGNGGVTVSPRFGTGQRQPTYSSGDTSITVLAGQSNSDGSMVADVRCDGCISWSGGSMDPTSSSSSWIWAIKSGDPIDSTDLSENLSQHDTMGTMTIDLTQGTGGSSSNPFIAGGSSSSSSSSAGGSAATTSAGSAATTSGGSAASSTSGTATSQSSTTSVTNLVPVATSSGSSSSSSTTTSSSPKNSTRTAHGVIMALLFLVFFPLFALTLYLPWAKRVRFVHAPLQILSIILLIVGLCLGVSLGKSIDTLNGYHQIIGYIVVGCLLGFQPALGIYQHLYYHRTGGRSALGVFHQWLGRIVILTGVVNGGLGMLQAGPVGNDYVPHFAVAAYTILALIVFVIYVVVVFISGRRAQNSPIREKPYDRGYEMHPSSHERSTSPTNVNYQSRNYPQQYR